jgi:hypothetical protein
LSHEEFVTMTDRPQVLDVVALLDDLPHASLPRGQVGTIVEALNAETALVEFSDDSGRAYAVVPIPIARLLPLHYEPVAA